VSGSINSGNSGGPVLDATGEVVAVATLRISGREGLAFGIPAPDVANALSRVQRATEGELASMHARYEAGVAVGRLHAFGTRCVGAMSIHLSAMEVAEAKKLPLEAGLFVAEEATRDFLARAVREFNSYGLDPHLRSIAGASLDRTVAADLKRLREVVAEAHGHVTRPTQDVKRYAGALEQCRIHVKGLSDQLARALDVELPNDADVLSDD
jgi:hypothetical protein